MRVVGWFLTIVGVSIAGLWLLLLATGQVVEIDDGRVDIYFHLAAELISAVFLVGAGVAVLRRTPRSRLFAAFAIGALAYTSVNSAGYYAQSGDWPVVGMFAGIVAATAGVAVALLRPASAERRDEQPAPTSTATTARSPTAT